MLSLREQMLGSPSLLAIDVSQMGLKSLVHPRLVHRSRAYPFDPKDREFVVLAPKVSRKSLMRPLRVSFTKRADADAFIRNAIHYGWDTAFEGAFCT